MARGSKAHERRGMLKPSKRKAGRKKSVSKRTIRKTVGGPADNPTIDVKSLARIYAPGAIRELARLSVEAQSESARISAIEKILDRAYGPLRTTAGTSEKPLEIIVGVSASLDAKLDRIAHAIAVGTAQG